MFQKVKQAREIYRSEGAFTLFRYSVPWVYRQTIRRILPHKGYVELNGVKVQKKKLLDEKLPNERWHWNKADNKDYESGIINLYSKSLKEGGSVTIIGGGYGVSMVRAAEIVGPSGSINVYEGSKKQVQMLEDLVDRYNIKSVCNIEPSVVGEDIKLYGSDIVSKKISPSQIEKCDTLELDCEGAEFSLIPALKFKPKNIIVEIHPHLTNEDPKN